jgi:hypothetical protein
MGDPKTIFQDVDDVSPRIPVFYFLVADNQKRGK